MRLALRRIVREAVRGRQLGWLFRQGAKYPLVLAASRWNLPPLTGPVLCGLCITHRCNERCLMCDLPMRPDGEPRRELSTAEWLDVVDDMAGAGGSSFSIVGGEPLLRRDLAELVGHIRSKRLPVAVNTNGLLLNNRVVRGEFLCSPPSAVNISVDGADAETYDFLRGIEGAFDTLLRAVEALVRERRQRQLVFAINAVCVLSPKTLPQVKAIVGLCESLGFDSIGFMPIHEIPSVNGVYGDKLERLWSSDAKRSHLAGVVETIDWLLQREQERRGLPLENSAAYLKSIPLAFMNRESPSQCVTGHLNTVVDPYGDVFPCWPFHEWKRPAIGNVREHRWRDIWRSSDYAVARRQTRECRACFWDCHLEENVLFDPPRVDGLSEARRFLHRAPRGAARTTEPQNS